MLLTRRVIFGSQRSANSLQSLDSRRMNPRTLSSLLEKSHSAITSDHDFQLGEGPHAGLPGPLL